MLYWSSGLSWDESYENSVHPSDSDVINMLYGSGRNDMASYIAQANKQYEASNTYHYSSGDSNLLMGVAKNIWVMMKSTSIKVISNLAISDICWEQDLSGTFIGSSYLFCSNKRDLLRLNEMTQPGVWGNKVVFLKVTYLDQNWQWPRWNSRRSLVA